MLEQGIESKACKILWEEHGVPSIKLTMVTESGWPDRLFILPNGEVKFIEFKRPGEQRQPRQVLMHELLIAFGHTVETYDNTRDAVQAVTKALAGR